MMKGSAKKPETIMIMTVAYKIIIEQFIVTIRRRW